MRGLALLLAMSWSAGAGGQVAAGDASGGAQVARVSYHQERPGLEVPSYTLSIGEDGAGVYHGELAPVKGRSGGERGGCRAAAPPVEREVRFSAATTAKVFELARGADRFQMTCASKAKNIADTGSKMLVYVGADGSGQCAYNYTEAKPIVVLTEIFQTAAATIEMGRKLDFMRRFDRLGLDAEMITLGTMLDGHQASEVGTIAPTLRAIAGDSELLQRVRSRAAKLLQQAEEGAP